MFITNMDPKRRHLNLDKDGHTFFAMRASFGNETNAEQSYLQVKVKQLNKSVGVNCCSSILVKATHK